MLLTSKLNGTHHASNMYILSENRCDRFKIEQAESENSLGPHTVCLHGEVLGVEWGPTPAGGCRKWA